VRRGFTIWETSWCAIGLPIEIDRSGTRVGRLGVKEDHISWEEWVVLRWDSSGNELWDEGQVSSDNNLLGSNDNLWRQISWTVLRVFRHKVRF